MAHFALELLAPSDLTAIHQTSLQILDEVGVKVFHPDVLTALAEAGSRVDFAAQTARFRPEQVTAALAASGKSFSYHGRLPGREARFGQGQVNLMSSPGQYATFDGDGARRPATLEDARRAARLGEALPAVRVVGAMSVPVDVPDPIRDVVLTRELVALTGKPTRCWPVSRQSSRYTLEIYAALAGGKEALRARPMVDTFLEPISPLQLPHTGLDIMYNFLEYGQPISIGPMAMVAGTGPGTLAGTLAQENAEILAGIVAVQTLAPGTPVIYGGIPHIMDPRTSICAFGAPEQGLMAAAMAQMGKSYGLPVYVNVNLTDAKVLDVQAGLEKMSSILLGVLAGADMLGHGGIVGTDHGGSLTWLAVDNEIFQFVQRLQQGVDIDAETLAAPIIAAVGPGGNFLTESHTVRHFRQQLWTPNTLWTRQTYDAWHEAGATTMAQRAAARVDKLLAAAPDEAALPPLDEALSRELDRIVAAARRELLT